MYSDIPLSPCGKEEEEEKKKMANLALWLRSQQPLSEQLRGLGITATASSAVFNHFQKFEREGFFFFFPSGPPFHPHKNHICKRKRALTNDTHFHTAVVLQGTTEQ